MNETRCDIKSFDILHNEKRHKNQSFEISHSLRGRLYYAVVFQHMSACGIIFVYFWTFGTPLLEGWLLVVVPSTAWNPSLLQMASRIYLLSLGGVS